MALTFETRNECLTRGTHSVNGHGKWYHCAFPLLRHRRRESFGNPAYNSSAHGAKLEELKWLVGPVPKTFEKHVLPPFSVQANPMVEDEVQLIVHSSCDGEAQVSGSLTKSFVQRGPTKPSVVEFNDISIRRAGRYVFQVKSLRNPELSVIAEYPVEIVPPACPQYRLHHNYVPENVNVYKMCAAAIF